MRRSKTSSKRFSAMRSWMKQTCLCIIWEECLVREKQVAAEAADAALEGAPSPALEGAPSQEGGTPREGANPADLHCSRKSLLDRWRPMGC